MNTAMWGLLAGLGAGLGAVVLGGLAVWRRRPRLTQPDPRVQATADKATEREVTRIETDHAEAVQEVRDAAAVEDPSARLDALLDLDRRR